jgi:hypothetical protein
MFYSTRDFQNFSNLLRILINGEERVSSGNWSAIKEYNTVDIKLLKE